MYFVSFWFKINYKMSIVKSNMKPIHIIFILIIGVCISCNNTPKAPITDSQTTDYPTIGTIEKLADGLDKIIAPDTKIEVLAEGSAWSEGPLWLEKEQKVIFSDVPRDTIYEWTPEGGKGVYLTPSGFTGESTTSYEKGSNGLLFNAKGQLVLCQHGNRQVAIMDAPLDAPQPNYQPIATQYDGKRFNSPNDACYHSNGDLYFTDPPYGLAQKDDDPTKEIPFSGVYRVQPDGTVDLLVDSITKPNGIALSPDEKTLYVACSDPEKARWYAYDVLDNGLVGNGRIFYDATALIGQEGEQGLPDGLKVDNNGIIFATGPSGVWIFDANGTVLGKIRTTRATANCAIGEGGKTLFITAADLLLRVSLL